MEALALGLFGQPYMFFLIFWLVAMFFIVIAYGFNIWMVIDCYKRDFKDRDIWLIVLLVGLLVGYGFVLSLVYYFVVKRPRDQT